MSTTPEHDDRDTRPARRGSHRHAASRVPKERAGEERHGPRRQPLTEAEQERLDWNADELPGATGAGVAANAEHRGPVRTRRRKTD
jgi:hypothetical protein